MDSPMTKLSKGIDGILPNLGELAVWEGNSLISHNGQTTSVDLDDIGVSDYMSGKTIHRVMPVMNETGTDLKVIIVFTDKTSVILKAYSTNGDYPLEYGWKIVEKV